MIGDSEDTNGKNLQFGKAVIIIVKLWPILLSSSFRPYFKSIPCQIENTRKVTILSPFGRFLVDVSM